MSAGWGSPAVRHLRCSQCPFLSTTRKGLSIHQRKIHNLVSKGSFSRRKATATNAHNKLVKAVQQDQIEQQTASMKSETWGAPFKCMICGALHSDKLHLGQHFNTHHAERGEESVQQVSTATAEDGSKPSTSSAPSANTTGSSASSPLTSHSLEHVSVPHASYTSTPIRGPVGQILGWIRTPIRDGVQDATDPTTTYHHQFSVPVMNPLVHGPPPQYSRLPTDIVYKDEPDEYVSEYYLPPSYHEPHLHHHVLPLPHPSNSLAQHQLPPVAQHQHAQQPLQAQTFYYGNSVSYDARPSDHSSTSYTG